MILKSSLKNLQFSWKYTKNHRGLLAFAASCQMLGAVLAVAAPIVSARIITAYANDEAWKVMYIALALLIIQLLRNLFQVISNQSYNRMYVKTLSALENDLVRGVLELESRCIDEKGSGLFIQRLTGDTSRIAAGFNSMADMVTQLLNYVGVLIAMFVINPMISLFVLFMMAAQSAIEVWRTQRLRKDDKEYRKANERFYGLVGEMVRGARDIRLLHSEEDFASELGERIDEANGKRLYMQRRSWSFKLFRWEIGEAGSFAMIALLAALISQKAILPSVALVLYNYYADLGPNAVKFIGNFLEFLADFNLSNERVQALLDGQEFPKEQFGSAELEAVRGEITFDRVTFAYEDHPGKPAKNILDEMSFCIRPGETAALVGRSGCGKTTTFNLINKLYEAQGGVVRIDGIDIRELSRDALRSNITVVSQNPYIFNMSVKDNLRLVRPDLTDQEMQEICALACIDEDIRQMPQGYDSIIGEGGVNLSGGQRQRLAIARAMVRNTRIILFDEATSALDNITQAGIQEAIENMRKGRTVVLVAHRLSTVMNADRILYMQDGKILAEGRHEELLKICEPYRILAEMEGKKEPEEERSTKNE